LSEVTKTQFNLTKSSFSIRQLLNLDLWQRLNAMYKKEQLLMREEQREREREREREEEYERERDKNVTFSNHRT